MRIQAKICGLNAPDGFAAAEAGGATMVGLVFYARSPRYVTPEEGARLTAGLAPGIKRVGLFVDVDDRAIAQTLAHVRLDLLQFHGAETPEQVAQVKTRFGLPVMKAIKVSDPADLKAARSYIGKADWILFDAKPPKSMTGALPGGNAVSFDWRILDGLDLPCPWMLSGGLDPENVAEAVRVSGARAVDVSSGVEARPGRKDPEKIRAFLDAARQL